jgi:hypothetical protein
MNKIKTILLVLFVIGIIMGIVQLIMVFFGGVIMFSLAL